MSPRRTPTRVLILSPVADLYGSTRSMVETLGLVDPELVLPAWALPEEGPLAAELRSRGVPYAVVPELRLLRSSDGAGRQLFKAAAGLPVGAIKVARLTSRNRIDVVHSNSATVLAGAYGARLGGASHLWYVREMIPTNSPFATLLRHQIRTRADEIFCVSSPVAEQLGEAPVSVSVVHSGIDWGRIGGADRARARAGFGIPEEAVVVGSSGYLNPRKGMDVLLEAYARVRERAEAPTRLLLAGSPFPGNEAFAAGLEARAAALGLDEEVIIPGYLAEIAPFLAALDVFVLTPREPEGLGRALLEAMASGLAVVAVATGGMTDVVEAGRTGILVRAPEPELVAEALGGLLADPQRRGRLGAAAKCSVQTRFRLDHTAERLTASYSRLAAR